VGRVYQVGCHLGGGREGAGTNLWHKHIQRYQEALKQETR